jgi:hypothetical protein
MFYPQKYIFNSDEEKKEGMKNYGFITISFYGNMFFIVIWLVKTARVPRAFN